MDQTYEHDINNYFRCAKKGRMNHFYNVESHEQSEQFSPLLLVTVRVFTIGDI